MHQSYAVWGGLKVTPALCSTWQQTHPCISLHLPHAADPVNSVPWQVRHIPEDGDAAIGGCQEVFLRCQEGLTEQAQHACFVSRCQQSNVGVQKVQNLCSLSLCCHDRVLGVLSGATSANLANHLPLLARSIST